MSTARYCRIAEISLSALPRLLFSIFLPFRSFLLALRVFAVSCLSTFQRAIPDLQPRRPRPTIKKERRRIRDSLVRRRDGGNTRGSFSKVGETAFPLVSREEHVRARSLRSTRMWPACSISLEMVRSVTVTRTPEKSATRTLLMARITTTSHRRCSPGSCHESVERRS